MSHCNDTAAEAAAQRTFEEWGVLRQWTNPTPYSFWDYIKDQIQFVRALFS